MVELILARHAKSDWGDSELADHERPLNARGSRDAPVMARRLAAAGAAPGRILSSTAVRARTTAAEFGSALGVEVELDEGLYLASMSTLLAKAAGAGSPSVMLVAHDPGLSALAFHLSNGGIAHMPTCAVARFTWPTASWDEASSRTPDSWSLDTPR